MQLTDEEIREILIREKKRKRRKQIIRRRISLAVLLVAIIVLGVGIFINKDARVSARGIIFIDPAHGGVDGGSVVGERLEKDDTLRFSLAVKQELEALGFKVYMSRDKDEDIDRDSRGQMANEKNAQLFVSFHRNKAEEGTGVEIYIPSTNDEASQLLGNNLMAAFKAQGFEDRGVRIGTLVGSDKDYSENKYSNMPSCLAEIGFMQNDNDNELFDSNLEANAKAVAEAISNTFAELYETDSDE